MDASELPAGWNFPAEVILPDPNKMNEVTDIQNVVRKMKGSGIQVTTKLRVFVSSIVDENDPERIKKPLAAHHRGHMETVVSGILEKKLHKQEIPIKGDKLDIKTSDIEKEATPRLKEKLNIEHTNFVDVKAMAVNSFGKMTRTIKQKQKIWEVFFDHKDKHSDKGHRIDPLILDLKYGWKV